MAGEFSIDGGVEPRYKLWPCVSQIDMTAKNSPAYFSRGWRLLALCCVAAVRVNESRAQNFAEFSPGAAYANQVIASEPWSIHIVRIDRSRSDFEIQSTHARNAAVGMGTLTEQISSAKPEWGKAIAAINGDFYERGRAYAGDPRGLQIVAGEVFSAPAPGATFWIDAAGTMHVGKVESRFTVTWPDGSNTPLRLNEDRGTNNGPVLYTPAMGASTLTSPASVELVLERSGNSAWLPLKVGETFTAKVREVREMGRTPIPSDAMVISLKPDYARSLAKLEAGALLKISTATVPDLRGARTALSAGPHLVHEGKKQDWSNATPAPGRMAQFSIRSMSERHPRSAVGWSDRYFFFAEVDGRQPESAGMTLDELATYMMKLGSTEVMNLDGGGSAMLWVNGHIANSPSDPGHRERPIANGLVIFRKPATKTTSEQASKH